MNLLVKWIPVSIMTASALFLTGCGSSSSSKPTKDGLYIKAAVYDTNKTADITDDTLSIYFNRTVDINTSDENLSQSFDINGTGAFGNSVNLDYNDSMFHRLKITLDANSTKFIAGETNIALSNLNKLQNIFSLNHSNVIVTSPRRLHKTGQSVSYLAHDDGEYQTGESRSFTSNGDGTITDDVTGLVWQESDDDTLRDWDSAKRYCEALTTANLEWQLPSMDQLIELSDKGTHKPAIDSSFSDTKNSEYWSGDEYLATSRDDIWTVNFTNSRTNNPEKTVTHYVRCVNTPIVQGEARYTRNNAKQIVLDASTNLIWQDTADTVSDTAKKTWSEAVDKCEQLDLGGYSDWRLPNLNELNSITDKTTHGPAMDREFKNKKSTKFWSSTTEDANSSSAWYSYFWCGCNDVQDKTEKDNVRCVRSAEQ